MLKAQEIKRIISINLKDKLSNDGFIYNKTDNEFRNKKGDFIHIFNIDQVSWSTSVSLHVRLYISQIRIESVFEEILGKQRHKQTLGNDIGKIYESPDGREVKKGDMSIWIREDEDIGSAVESLKLYYNDIAKKYFSKYDNLSSIDNIVNNPPFSYSPAHVGGNFDERCMKGLIVAKLVNNPDYNKIVGIYDEEIKETRNSESIGNYLKVKDYLKSNSIQ